MKQEYVYSLDGEDYYPESFTTIEAAKKAGVNKLKKFPLCKTVWVAKLHRHTWGELIDGLDIANYISEHVKSNLVEVASEAEFEEACAVIDDKLDDFVIFSEPTKTIFEKLEIKLDDKIAESAYTAIDPIEFKLIN